MKRNVTGILREWFYRLPNGYAIEPYVDTELQVLSKILTENNIDPKPILESLRGDIMEAPMEKIPAGLTEIFHESFFAIALAAILGGKPLTPEKFYTQGPDGSIENQGSLIGFDELIKLIKGLNFLLEGDKILADLKANEKWLVYPKEDGSKPFRYQNINYKGNSDFDDMFKDAIYSAERTFDAIQSLYGGTSLPQITGVKRMTGKRSDGTKPVEDSVVLVRTPEGVEETILISLKMGAGQFGSLSVQQILELAFGIKGDTTTRLLETMRTEGYKTGIDETLTTFITVINNVIDEKYGGSLLAAAEDAPSLSAGSAKKGGHGIRVISELQKLIPKQYLLNGKLDPSISYEAYQGSKVIRGVYYKLYNLVATGNDYIIAKKEKLNPSIDKYFTDKQTEETNLTELVKYLLRADDNYAYLYVSKEGKNSHVIPSKKQIDAKADNVKVNIKEYKSNEADYLRDIEIIDKTTGNVLITVPNKFRWGNGQWNGKLSNFSSAPTFTEHFVEYFGGWGYDKPAPEVKG